MIIEGLISVVVSLVSFFLGLFPFDIPSFPSEVTDIFNQIVSYWSMGIQILNNYVYSNVVVALLAITIILFNAENIWSVCKWIVKKIPFLNIEL